MFNSPIITIFNPEPSWQHEEDAIVGKMIRQLLSFEGKLLSKDTLRSMESIIEGAAQMADQIGARGDYVRSIGNRISIDHTGHWP